MKIVYIDNSESNAILMKQLVIQHSSLECIAITDSKKAVVHLLELNIRPAAIVINCSIKDIPCKALIEFVRKRDLLRETTLIVISAYFTGGEQRQYTSLGVDHCLEAKLDVGSVMHLIGYIREYDKSRG